MRRIPQLVVVLGVAVILALAMLSSTGSIAHAGNIDAAADPDNDGCTTAEELGVNPAAGGMRDPNNPWDFFDTPPRDNSIVIGDILRVVAHFGTSDGGPNYYEAFDRSPPPPGADLWDLREPDGSVTINDILMVVVQFGHACTEIEWCNDNVKPLALLDTEPYEVTPAEPLWRDCFEVLDENGGVVDYVTREATVEVESEELTDEEVTALGLTLPQQWWDGDEDGPLGTLSVSAFPPWKNYYCKGTVRTVNLGRRTVNAVYIEQRWTTTPYTNIVWPPSRGNAWAESNFLWHVEADPEARPSPYPLLNYSPGIVARGQNFVRSRHRLSIGPITILEQTLRQWLTFNYGFSYRAPYWCTVRGAAG